MKLTCNFFIYSSCRQVHIKHISSLARTVTKVCNYTHKFVSWFRLFNLTKKKKNKFYIRTSKCYGYTSTYLIIIWPNFVSNSVSFFFCVHIVGYMFILPHRINMKLFHSLPNNIHIIKDFFIIFPLIFSQRRAWQDISLINYSHLYLQVIFGILQTYTWIGLIQLKEM